jgi:hypothetical protein
VASQSRPYSDPIGKGAVVFWFPQLLTVAISGLLIWVLYSVSRPRPAFVVRVKSGVPRVTRGTVTPAFVAEVAEVCRRHGVQDATITGVVNQRQIALAFSRGVTPNCAQQLRNIWSVSGWSASR